MGSLRGKRLMVLGAGPLQLPVISKAKEMGIFVVALDADANAVGFYVADAIEHVSTIDIPNALDAAKRHGINGVMTAATDLPVRTVAAIAADLGLVGLDPETASRATNKGEMRECLSRCGVPVPKYFRIMDGVQYEAIVKTLSSPFILKPADNSGSRGVFLVHDPYDSKSVRYAYEYSKANSRSGEVVLEDYMVGSEVSVETLSIGGEVRIIANVNVSVGVLQNLLHFGHRWR